MTLKDTMGLMNSDDYKDRFITEYLQVKIRKDKLADMIEKYHKGTLEFVPSCPISMLERQLYHMKNYLDILEHRALIEEIELYGRNNN